MHSLHNKSCAAQKNVCRTPYLASMKPSACTWDIIRIVKLGHHYSLPFKGWGQNIYVASRVRARSESIEHPPLANPDHHTPNTKSRECPSKKGDSPGDRSKVVYPGRGGRQVAHDTTCREYRQPPESSVNEMVCQRLPNGDAGLKSQQTPDKSEHDGQPIRTPKHPSSGRQKDTGAAITARIYVAPLPHCCTRIEVLSNA